MYRCAECIPVESLNGCHSALSYFDAEGMRFHLPAFLIAALRGGFRFDLVFSLTESSLLEDQMRLLSAEQRAVVRQFLELCRSGLLDVWDEGAIKVALRAYWAR